MRRGSDRPAPPIQIAALVGSVVSGVVVVVLLLASRLLPPGRPRDLAGFIPNCVVVLRRLRADRRLPGQTRLALGVALAYVVSPIQLIPNFVPVIGQTDDLVVVIVALRYACRRLPRQDVEAAWPGDPKTLDRLLGRHRAISAPTDRGG